jgi:hypothetical protein
MTRFIGRLTAFSLVSAVSVIVLAACSPAETNNEAEAAATEVGAPVPDNCDKFLGAWSAESPPARSSLTIMWIGVEKGPR